MSDSSEVVALDVVDVETGKITSSVDVRGKSPRMVRRVASGMRINMSARFMVRERTLRESYEIALKALNHG